MGFGRSIYIICCLLLLFQAEYLHAQQLVITAVGDIMLAGSGSATYAKQGYDYPFLETCDTLRAGDIIVGNLEAPITRMGCEFKEKQFRFKAHPKAASALKNAGFSVLTLANNHMLDYGTQGLDETIRHLDQVGILHTGAGSNLTEARKEAIVSCKNKKVAFLAYSMTFPLEFYAKGKAPGTSPGVEAYFSEDIRRLKNHVDYIVVSFHWGTEKSTIPKPYQISAAHAAIDSGADVILGHHPHVLQGIEIYQGKTIFYSLGNFAFGCFSPSCARSAIVKIKLEGASQLVELIPLNVLNAEIRFKPSILQGERGEKVMSDLNELCLPLGTRITISDGTYRLERGVKPELAGSP